ncbi:ATP-binding protein [Halomonas korlensis]|uniref:Sensory/regulatory protein RpfC n=1 Tax=Halomonas korlensis TaxID=463301 RepID=A0A1I7G9Q2_9GAMM|nr:ATP-binding protein [Halomonas korlensis]SFU45183.1 Signal transduction histidine kinase [Halomonas korlensis]
MLRYPLRLKLGATSALIFFAAALVVVGLASWRQESLARSVGGDAVWHAYKLDRDTLQLWHYLRQPEPAMEDLRRRFELVYGRLNLLRRGDVAELIEVIPTAVALMEEVGARIEVLDRQLERLQALDVDTRSQLAQRLDALSQRTEPLIIAINGHLANSATQERQQLQSLYALLMALILAMSVAAMLVVMFLFREARDNAAARRKLEVLSQELKATARRAQTANETKSLFLATVSHEIRTPLNGVIGMSDLLLDQPLEGRPRHYAHTIHNSAGLLLELINDLLDFSKIEADRLELESRPVALSELVEGVMALFAHRAESRGVRLASHLDPRLPPRVISDPGRLRQVLLNLLSNAIKFTDQGEILLMATVSEPGRLRFDVIDTGGGITAEQLPRLFEPFQQGDASTARHFGGTGLGLAICRRLVEALGGHLEVQSEPGVGSRFWFELPMMAADNDPVESTRQASPLVRLDESQLLVVEDNPVNRQVAVAMLERFGCRVSAAESGTEGLKKAEQTRFDLIFMDVQMADLDGLEVTRRLRARGGWCGEVPIIAMTAGGPGGEQPRCLAAGMNGYLTKPLFQEALEAVLRRHLHKTDIGSQAVASFAKPAGAEPHITDQSLDQATLAALRENLGEHGLASLIALYREQVETRLAELDQALGAASSERVNQLAHQLKGESSSLGAVKVAGLAALLERLGREGQLGEAGVVIHDLKRCLMLTLQGLESWSTSS